MQKTNEIKLVKPSIILLGFITFISQVIFLREFLTFFNGNELVIGVILANWMLLTGFGAYLGRFFKNNRKRERWILFFLYLLALLSFSSVTALHYAWYKIYAPGIMAGLIQVFYYSLFVLSPFCILSGILFTLLSKEESVACNKNKIGDVYAWEALGSTIGGLILNFILIWLLSTFQSLYLIVNIALLFIMIKTVQKNKLIFSGLIFITITGFNILFFLNDFDKQIRQIAFPGQEITFSKDSPFGVFIITNQNGQKNYYENNVLISSTGDIISREESAHISMIQHKKPSNILVLSGITTGIVEEIIKYPVKSIDYVDINPEIIAIAKQYFKADTIKQLNLIEKDAIRYLRSNKKKYDIVLINLPKPSTIHLNRFYTKEFFGLLKKSLTNKSIISLSVPSSSNYMNEEAKKFLSIIYATLKSEFKNVEIYPLNEDFLLASDTKLSMNISEKISQSNIKNQYVNEYYFDDELLKIRSVKVLDQLIADISLNQDFSPVFYQSQIRLWLSKLDIKYWIPAILIILFSGFFFFKAGSVYKGVFAAGFTSTSIEIILLLVFQVVFGYVYAVAGIFIMIFMGGLALGSYYLPKYISINKNTFRKIQFGLSLFAFLLPVIFLMVKNFNTNDYLLFSIFTLLLLVISVLTGGIFSLASKLIKEDYATIASNAYGLDLLGAATGALLFTIYLIPILGFLWSVIISGLFNLIVTLSTKK